ncbi:hybrid sensor histidine kinase/response regulator [Piscinibacter defluvii]|uniref:hybrid sensor histidine kinase/response regulator n=1 Tax=Piscinibacter defluvii TaxID=1796922 RepID=UPI000FDEA553|nr:transporter substrate-binding domain-containing protein [Piscinibacter defluvii]
MRLLRGMVGIVGLLLLATGWATTSATESTPLPLNDEQRAWVAAHPVLTASFVRIPIPPLQSWTPDGRLEGIAADYLALVGRRTGLTIRPVIGKTLAERDAHFVERRAELLPLLLDGDPVGRHALATRHFFRAPAVWVTRRDDTEFSARGNLGGQRVVTTGGSAFEAWIRQRYPDARIQTVASPLEELHAVAEGRADLRMGQLPSTTYAIETHLLANLSVRAIADGAPSAYALGVHPEQRVLHSILELALASITPQEHQAILAKWVPARHLLDIDAAAVLLNDAERRWARAHPGVRAAYDRSFAPFTLESGRQMQGLGADLLRSALRHVGMAVTQELPGTGAEAEAALVAGQADLVVATPRSDERRDDLIYVGPWSSSPTAIVTRSDAGGPFQLGDLAGRSVAVSARYALVPTLKRRHPGIGVVEHGSLEAALASVRAGRAAAALGDFQVMSQLVQRDHPGVLTISGTVADGDSELFFAVRRDQPELARVLGKALESLSESERAPLRQRWMTAQYRPGWRLDEVLRVALPVLAVMLLAGALIQRSNRRLRHEVAQRRVAEQGLADALARERAASEAKSRFIASLSHEVRNPLGAIVSAAGLLGQRAGDAEQRRLLGSIRSAGDGLLELLSRTLDFSKAEVGALTLKPEWLDPLPWCRRVCAAFEPLAQARGLALQLQIDWPAGREALFDGVRLGQVLSNLLSNALKFTERGHVAVRLALDEPNARLRLVVQDSGPGFGADEQALLFQPYSQLPSTRARHAGGTGLGLALCKQIVARMDGRIAAHGEPGVGSRFEVEVPVQTRAAAADPAATPAPPGWPKGVCDEPVVLVDDDPVGLMVASEQLRAAGCAVQAFEHAEEALAQWQRRPARLLITDFHMPGLDGQELCRQIRQRPAPPGARPWIIALTGSDDPDVHARCLSSGADEVMLKPLQIERLVARLQPAPG